MQDQAEQWEDITCSYFVPPLMHFLTHNSWGMEASYIFTGVANPLARAWIDALSAENVGPLHRCLQEGMHTESTLLVSIPAPKLGARLVSVISQSTFQILNSIGKW